MRSECDEQAPPESRDQQPPESPTSGYNCASWEDSKSDQLTLIDAAWAPGDTFAQPVVCIRRKGHDVQMERLSCRITS